jgi:hypothetical protein
LPVGNTFPKLKVVADNRIKDYDCSDREEAHVSLITRPLTFGSPDFKKLERMFLRGTLYVRNTAEGKNSFILNYYSPDGIKFNFLRGIKINPSDRKDLDMGLFSRTKYRQFLFAFAGVLEEKSEIEYIESEIVKEYDNTKMR